MCSHRKFPKDRAWKESRRVSQVKEAGENLQTGRNSMWQRPCPRGCRMLSVANTEVNIYLRSPRGSP